MRCFRLQGRRGFLQHLQVVIGFQHQHVGGADAFEDQFGGVAEVGQKADVPAGRAQQKADRIGGVVRDGEGVHRDVADLKAARRGEDAAFKLALQLELDGFLGEPVAINGNVELRPGRPGR